jgi:hypothetical protein
MAREKRADVASANRARGALAALLVLALGALASCRSREATREDKAASFGPYADHRLDGVPLEQWLAARTAGVLTDFTIVTATAGPADVRFDSCATAASLTPDGYFLTAAHCVRRRPWLWVSRPGGGFDARPVRVVWAGSPGERALDLAILKSDQAAPATFAWADARDFPDGAELVTMGFGTALDVAGKLRAHGSAGRATQDPFPVERVSPTAPTVIAVVYDAPITAGDSGGPVATLSGGLAGVNIGTVDDWIGRSRGVAFRPDPAWIAARIEQDRRAYAAAPR